MEIEYSILEIEYINDWAHCFYLIKYNLEYIEEW
jgi:hypothetical protein